MTNANNFEPVIYTTKNYVQQKGIKFLGYSKPHKGKTDMIRTLPRPLVLATEDGLATLNKYDISYTPLRTVEQLVQYAKWLRAGGYKGKYDSIVLDSVSYLTVLLLAEYRSDPAKYTNNGQKHYGLLREHVLDFLAALFECDAIVYVTAWESENYDAFGVMTGVQPYTEGKSLQTYLIHYFDLTFHLDWHTMAIPQADGTTVNSQVAYLQTVEANGKFARCRLQGIDAFEPADLGALVKKIDNLRNSPT